MLNNKYIEIAKRKGVFDKVEKLKAELLQIPYVTEVDFDLDGLIDNINQCIFLPKYDIPTNIISYYEIKAQTLTSILKVAKDNGLRRTEDAIEDYGQHYYIVTNCKSWLK